MESKGQIQSRSMLMAHGVGGYVFADGSVEWQEGTSIMSKWRRRDGYVR